MAVNPVQLIDAAVEQGLINTEDISRLRVKARRERIDIIDALTTFGRFPVSVLYRALAEARGLPFFEPDDISVPPDLLKRLPEALIRRRLILPLGEEGGAVKVATADPDDRPTLDALQRILGKPLKVILADPPSMEVAITQAYMTSNRSDPEGISIDTVASTDPVALMDETLKEAYLRRASDIHLEPQAQGQRIRLRIDGRLQVYRAAVRSEEGSGLLSRIKVLSGMDIAEQRASQDGGFTYRPPHAPGQKVDIRVATAPTRWGERATLRLLGLETRDLTLEALGMSQRDLEYFQKTIKSPYGMVLLTGPTGSGKSTTLYAALRQINQPHVNIMTVEDPIEYVIEGISQTQISGGKVTFAGALRSMLRHDPDILMVGEVRDAETADVAMKAAMTGHLVFSTLHTNTAAAAITRLMDIGCERYFISSTLIAVIAQRLVRRLCTRCRKKRVATQDEAELLGHGKDPPEIYVPVGCPNCLGTGYRGRIGLFQALWVDREMALAINRGGLERELEEISSAKGVLKLQQDGFVKVLAGATSLDEVLNVTVMET